MPLNDWPLTSAFQLATPAWELTRNQFRAAMDNALIFEAETIGNWLNVNTTTLEAFSGISTDLILAGLRAARDTVTNPDHIRSMKCADLAPPTRFIQLNVIAFETATAISLLNLKNAVANAV